MTSAPVSASMRVQCGPAMVVEKSSTRRPAKLPVKWPSPCPAMVMVVHAPSGAVVSGARRDPSWQRAVQESLPPGAFPSPLRISGGKLDPILHSNMDGSGNEGVLKVLFVTTEMDDFVRVGGLAAVSAALPRALRSWSDVRIMLPGYRDVVEQFTHIEIVGQCAGACGDAGLLARADVDPGRAAGLCAAVPTTLRPAGQPLWRRERPRLARQRHPVRPACLRGGANSPWAGWTRIGQPTSSMPTTGRPRWYRPTSPGRAQASPRS